MFDLNAPRQTAIRIGRPDHKDSAQEAEPLQLSGAMQQVHNRPANTPTGSIATGGYGRLKPLAFSDMPR